MKHTVFVAVDDQDVDLLTRLRQNDGVTVEAVFHPDPSSLVSQLAVLSRLTVVNDRGGLAGLAPDVCIGGDRAAELALEWRENARLTGRPAPVFIPVADVPRYLEDITGYVARHHEVSAGIAPRDIPESAPVVANGQTVERLIPRIPPAETPFAASASEASAGRSTTPPGESLSDPPPRMEPSVVIPPPAPPAVGQSVARHHVDPAATAADGLGAPSVDLCFELPRLVAWLTEAAARHLNGSAAVVWQREPGGERHTLLGFSPQVAAMPALPTPPRLLEDLVQAGRAQVVPAARLFAGHEMLVPLSMVSVPLPGESGPFGLLGVFRPESLGALPDAVLSALEKRGPEFGQALERCARFAQMTQELRRLRFRDQLRDFLLAGRLSGPGRWEQFLALVLAEAPASAAYLYRLEPRASRLELTAMAGDELPPAGGFSVPVGRGFIGAAFQRPVVTVYSRDDLNDAADNHDLYLMPFRSRRAGQEAPVALLLLDGASGRTPSGQQTAAFLEELALMVAPFLE